MCTAADSATVDSLEIGLSSPQIIQEYLVLSHQPVDPSQFDRTKSLWGELCMNKFDEDEEFPWPKNRRQKKVSCFSLD